MLNWIVFWIGQRLLGSTGRSNANQRDVDDPSDVADSAKLWTFWGIRVLQGAPHRLPDGARSRSSSTGSSSTGRRSGTRCARSASTPTRPATAASTSRRSYFLAMAIAGTFAGVGGAIDILGWQYRARGRTTIQTSTIGFLGIAVALLGRNTAVGVGLSALLFGALLNGTSTAQPRPVGLQAGAREQPDARSSRASSCCSSAPTCWSCYAWNAGRSSGASERSWPATPQPEEAS